MTIDWFLISFLILIISISYLSANSYISFSVIPLPFINIYPSLDVNYFPSCSCYYFSSSSSLSPLYVSPFIICLLSVFSSYLSTICTYYSFFSYFFISWSSSSSSITKWEFTSFISSFFYINGFDVLSSSIFKNALSLTVFVGITFVVFISSYSAYMSLANSFTSFFISWKNSIDPTCEVCYLTCVNATVIFYLISSVFMFAFASVTFVFVFS